MNQDRSDIHSRQPGGIRMREVETPTERILGLLSLGLLVAFVFGLAVGWSVRGAATRTLDMPALHATQEVSGPVQQVAAKQTAGSTGDEADTTPEQTTDFSEDEPEPMAALREPSEPAVRIEEHVIEPGEPLVELVAPYGLSMTDLLDWFDASRGIFNLNRLRAGKTVRFVFEGDRLRRFEYVESLEQVWTIELAEAGPRARIAEADYRVETASIGGTIKGSLFETAAQMGLEDAVILELAEIFAWDVDFNRDLREGDTFVVALERRYFSNWAPRRGRVLAARLTNRGQTYEAFRFGEEPQYYDGDGRSVRKQFLKSPLPFGRVTSRFNLRRMHPILKKVRPHYGVDIAAPVGTPVMATASGTISYIGRKGGYGRYVELRHANGYRSGYAHLSRYAKGLRKGARLEQGETVGYVGSSGLSTGPHLDYSIKYNGKFINPDKLKSPPTEPVPSERREAYLAWVLQVRGLLSGSVPGDGWLVLDWPQAEAARGG